MRVGLETAKRRRDIHTCIHSSYREKSDVDTLSLGILLCDTQADRHLVIDIGRRTPREVKEQRDGRWIC